MFLPSLGCGLVHQYADAVASPPLSPVLYIQMPGIFGCLVYSDVWNIQMHEYSDAAQGLPEHADVASEDPAVVQAGVDLLLRALKVRLLPRACSPWQCCTIWITSALVHLVFSILITKAVRYRSQQAFKH
jgi:hypothetical protein